jgi:DNA invertase Pin-like site-specific DNA recombinase
LEAENMAIVGYARVSSESQDYERRVDALKAAGAGKVFAEKVSGARADRPQLAKMMATLKPGDVVIVTKIDRLGRSTQDLLNLIGEVRKAGANFKSLGDEMLNTTTANGNSCSRSLRQSPLTSGV